jgi:hypothetical protein
LLLLLSSRMPGPIPWNRESNVVDTFGKTKAGSYRFRRSPGRR